MTTNGCGIRAIARIMAYSRAKIQAALKRSKHQIVPKQKHYDTLQIDEFHTFVGHKKNKVWLGFSYATFGGEARKCYGYSHNISCQ